MTSINFHHITKMEAKSRNLTEWLHVENRNGDHIALHVDGRLAEMLAEAFAEYENWLSSQEGPTYDEALAMKCDRLAREDESRALK